MRSRRARNIDDRPVSAGFLVSKKNLPGVACWGRHVARGCAFPKNVCIRPWHASHAPCFQNDTKTPKCLPAQPTGKKHRRNHTSTPREQGGGPDHQHIYSAPAVSALQAASVPTVTGAELANVSSMLSSQEDQANDKQPKQPEQIVLSPKSAHARFMQSHEQAGTMKAGDCPASEINAHSITLKVSCTYLCSPPPPLHRQCAKAMTSNGAFASGGAHSTVTVAAYAVITCYHDVRLRSRFPRQDAASCL